MYRHLLRSVVPLASGSAIRSAQSNKAAFRINPKTCSALFGLAVIRHGGVTYSQWHCQRKAANSRKESFLGQHVNRQHQTAASSTTTQASESVREIFQQYHSLLEKGAFQPESVVDFSSALCSAVYSSLGWLPWLHNENYIISFMQILMNGKTNELLTQPLYSCTHFQSIYYHIVRNVPHIPGKDCPSILLSLIYSGLDQRDELVIKLLNRCYDIVSELNIQQLRDSAHVLQSLGNRDFVFAEKLVSRLNDILADDPQDINFKVRDLCVSNPVLAAYMSQELLEKCVSAMLFKAQEQFPNLDIPTIGCCFRYVRKMGFRADRENLTKIKTLAKSALDVFTDYDQLQSYHIAEICHNAKRLGCYTGKMVDRMQEQSLRLLRNNTGGLQISDVTNLLFAFTRDTSPDVKQEVCEVLMKNLDDADVLTLSNIADIMLELDVRDPELIMLFQSKVLQNIDNIAQYITRLVKVLRLLRERLEHNISFNRQICRILLQLLDRRQGYDPTFVVVVTQFILPNVRSVVPFILMECLMNVIPRCNLSLMLLILNGLEKMKGPWSRSLHNQVLEIRSQMQQNIGEQIENAAHATQLAHLIRGLHIKSQNRDFVLLDRIMDHYPRLMKSMTRHDYFHTVKVFKHMSHPYYHPRVFEDLIRFAEDNYSQITFYGILDLVNVLATAGYQPQDFDSFSNFVVQVLEEGLKDEACTGQISFAHYLTLMTIFPDTILGHIFTFDYLEQLDRIIEAEPERQQFLQSLMMQLNRCVILECPHLDVPWFHDQYCREQTKALGGKGFQKNLAFVDDVRGAFQDVMRGMEFVSEKVYSPYFHPIDFEIVLDSAGEPVSRAAVKLLSPDELGYQRVAVRLIANQQLCANSHQRRGQYLRDKRHLEILGYRVEEVTRYEWNSMALSDWGSKVNFVRNKIFQTSSREQSPPSWSQSTTMHPYWK